LSIGLGKNFDTHVFIIILFESYGRGGTELNYCIHRKIPPRRPVIHTLQGKDPLAEVFADAPIKIAQKSIYSG
jgi:hypothetical protein